MGRYDKIRVYKDGAWKQPTRMYVYDGTTKKWIDFGTNTSTNTNSFNVRSGSSWKRVTLNRKDTQKERGEFYAYGAFDLYPSSGFCYYPPSATWGFYMNVRKTTSGGKNICAIRNQYGDLTPYLYIEWLDDGRIHVRNKYPGYAEVTLTTNNSYGLNQWISINAYALKGTRTFVLEIVGHETVSKYMGNCFYNTGSLTTIGDNGLNYKDGFTCYGVDYSLNVHRVEFNFNDRPAKSGGTDYCSKISYNEKETYTETTWV